MKAPKINVAVTGASGQLGTHLVRRLLNSRKIGKITAIDRVPPQLAGAKLTHVDADVRDPQIARYFEGCDAVIHLAFIVTTRLDRREFDDINVQGSKNVFAAAAQTETVKHLLYASSVAAYGVAPGLPDPIEEDTPRRLVDDFPYSAAKYRVEEHLDTFEQQHPDLIVTRFRPTILVGARFNNPLGELFAKSMENGLLIGASDAELPVVWDEDVADAFMLALEKKAKGAFNVSADEPVSMQTLARETHLKLLKLPKIGVQALPAISKILPNGSVDPSWQKSAGVRVRSSSEKAKRELGWAPKHATGLAVMKHYLQTAHGRTDPRITAFMGLIGFAAKRQPPDPETIGLDAVVHFAITGKGGGDWTIRVQNQKMTIERGIPRPPKSIATLDVPTFRDLVAGKQAYGTAFVTGKLRIEGDPSAGFVVPGLFARFKAETEQKGMRGKAVRTFAKLITPQGEAR